MEVTISQFRRDLFQIVERAAQGEPVTITHRGRRFRVVPEGGGLPTLDRLTGLQIVNPQAPGLEDQSWKDEMIREWESDWAEL